MLKNCWLLPVLLEVSLALPAKLLKLILCVVTSSLSEYDWQQENPHLETFILSKSQHQQRKAKLKDGLFKQFFLVLMVCLWLTMVVFQSKSGMFGF